MSKKMYQQFFCNRMMLHEHRTGLSLQFRRMRRGEGCNAPSIDEQHLEEFERLVDESMMLGTQITLKIKISKNKGAGFHLVRGIVVNKDIRKGEIVLITEKGVEKIAVCHLLDIEK